MKTNYLTSKIKTMQSNKTLMISLVLFVFIACNTMQNPKTQTFKVWGNCGMCKKTIEKALDEKGIKGDWNKKTKMISVTYDSTKFTNQSVHEVICASGYDTEHCRADDKTYENLHECCKYERKK